MGMLATALVSTHVAASTALLFGSAVNFFLLNPLVTRYLAIITVPAMLPIFPLTLHRLKHFKDAFSRNFVLSLAAGGAVNIFLAVRTLSLPSITSKPVSMPAGISRMRLETALWVSCVGATILNGRRFVPRFGLQGTLLGDVWMWFSQRPLLSVGVVEGLGALLLVYERFRLASGSAAL